MRMVPLAFRPLPPIDNPDFYETLSAFERLTGLPLVINTSFNVNGETIVNTAQDAIESFGFMDIDYLALGPYWISKQENLHLFPAYTHDQYLDIRRSRYREQNYGHLTTIDISQFEPCFFEGWEAVKQFVMDHVPTRGNHLAHSVP